MSQAECSKEIVIGRRVTGAIRSLVNARSLQLEYVRSWHESLLVPVLMYGSETMKWREKEGSRIWYVQYGQPQWFAEYQENGLSPEYIYKSVVLSDKGYG